MLGSVGNDHSISLFIRNLGGKTKTKQMYGKDYFVASGDLSHGPQEELVSDDGCITTLYLLPNCTALIQPLDQNAIRSRKLF